ncbi:MAG: ComEC/Rec2 family competence protein [Parachlamydiaceae bacterium]|nr:ComEC/Rec2 family competence protein [Parachlamydiaceae bacterium]
MPASLKTLLSLANLLHALAFFWQQFPALLYGMAFLLGCSFALFPNAIFAIPFFLIWAPLFFQRPKLDTTTKRLLLGLIVLVSALAYVKFTIKFPDRASKQELDGIATFEIESFSAATKHFGSSWRYTGKILSFFADGEQIAKNLTAIIQFPSQFIPPDADKSYNIEGILREVTPQRYLLIPNKDKPWISIEGTFSLAKNRYQAKQKVSEYIRKHIHDSQSANFLVGIATGNFQDRLMTYEFGRFGLQHIMAISGFHFAIVASILNFLLSLIFPRWYVTLFLIFLLSSYFVFLGPSPSIMRAWIASILLFSSFLLERKSSGLNSLGIALLTILIIDPQLCINLGFQFSFVATAAIFLLYPTMELLLRNLFPKRPLSIMIQMSQASQHGYTFLSACRHAIALTLAINIVALPLTLFYFSKFPLMSLFYNLFFPFMVSISMTLLLLGSCLELLIPPLGTAVHFLNDNYTHFLLSYTYNIPTTIDLFIRSSSVTFESVVVFLCVAFGISISALFYQEKKREEIDDWSFI